MLHARIEDEATSVDEASREMMSPVAILHVAGEWLARAAERELSAMSAFERFSDELLAQGAPDWLAADALAVAHEKARNSAVLGALAKRFHGTPVDPQPKSVELRSLHLLAVANTTEGVVSGAFAALVGLHQAQHAYDDAFRTAIARVARHQLRHAEVAWRIAQWLDEHLSETGRRAVQAAKKRAIARLCFITDRIASGLEEDARELLGLPDSVALSKILAELDGLFS